MAVCLFLSLASADKSKAAHNMPTMGYNKIIATSLVVSVLIALCVSVFRFAVSGDFKPSAATAQQTVSPADRAAAQQKLDDILSKAKTAGLVTSYDLSSVPVIYVGPVWYTQTVQFKKDFLASIAMGLQTTIGKYFLEARTDTPTKRLAKSKRSVAPSKSTNNRRLRISKAPHSRGFACAINSQRSRYCHRHNRRSSSELIVISPIRDHLPTKPSASAFASKASIAATLSTKDKVILGARSRSHYATSSRRPCHESRYENST